MVDVSFSAVTSHELGGGDGQFLYLGNKVFLGHRFWERTPEGVEGEVIAVDPVGWAWASIGSFAEIVCNLLAGHWSSPGDFVNILWYIIYQPVNPVASGCIRVNHGQRETVGLRWCIAPSKMGRDVLAVAGEAARNEPFMFEIVAPKLHTYRQYHPKRSNQLKTFAEPAE